MDGVMGNCPCCGIRIDLAEARDALGQQLVAELERGAVWRLDTTPRGVYGPFRRKCGKNSLTLKQLAPKLGLSYGVAVVLADRAWRRLAAKTAMSRPISNRPVTPSPGSDLPGESP